MERNRLRLLISCIIYCFLIIIEPIIMVFNIWPKKVIKILYFFYYFFNFFHFIYYTLLTLNSLYSFLNSYRNKFLKYFRIIHIIKIALYVYGFILLFLNYYYFYIYWMNCPYTISDLDYKDHYKRRCELYNINNNSRYSYQYICSYDSTKEFKKFYNKYNKLKEEIKPDKVICIKVNELIKNNKIIQQFNNEYDISKNYYCSRTNIPKEVDFAKHKDCSTKSYVLHFIMFIIIFINYINYIYFSLYLSSFRLQELLNNIIINNNLSNNSTKISDNPNHNSIIKYERKKTKNILIENKKVYEIKTNIEDLEKITRNNNKISDINNINNIQSIEFSKDIISEEKKF